MANELRKISFSAAEVQVALKAFATRMNKAMPKEAVNSFKEDSGGRVIVYFGEFCETEIALQSKEMITALLVLCQEKNIPVPKGGKKMLKMDDKNIILMIKLV